MYGVEILANITQMILDGTYKQRLNAQISFFIIVAIIAITMLLGKFLKIKYFIPAMFAISAGYMGIVFVARSNSIVMEVVAPFIAIFLVFFYYLVYNYMESTIAEEKIRREFRKYVDPNLADSLISKGFETGAASQNKHISVMFIDIRGFTPLTEYLKDTPEKVVKILNEYLNLTSSSVFDNGGSVDKFIGDATMALFNGFVPQEDYVYKSVKAAWDMVQKAQELDEKFKKELGLSVGFGIGIHCGEALVGNIGTEFRQDYTAIGDAVNTAARLESQASVSQVLISKDVYEQVKDRVKVKLVGDIPLKGKLNHLQVYSLEGLT
jgi:adenylate cyclase